MSDTITHCECPWCGCLMEVEIEEANLCYLIGKHPVECWLHEREIPIDYSYVLTWHKWKERK